MSWRVKRWKNGKYGLWTTISDGYLHKPKKLTRDEIIEFIIELYQEEFDEKIRKLKVCFPNGWGDKDVWNIRIEDKRFMSEREFNKKELERLKK